MKEASNYIILYKLNYHTVAIANKIDWKVYVPSIDDFIYPISNSRRRIIHPILDRFTIWSKVKVRLRTAASRNRVKNLCHGEKAKERAKRRLRKGKQRLERRVRKAGAKEGKQRTTKSKGCERARRSIFLVVVKIKRNKCIKEKKKINKRLTFAVALIGDGNGATCAAGGESQVAGTLVGVSVGPANGACDGSLLRGRLGAPAGAPHAVRAQVLVQHAAPTLAATDPYARTCSTLYTLLRTVVNRPCDRRLDDYPSPISHSFSITNHLKICFRSKAKRLSIIGNS